MDDDTQFCISCGAKAVSDGQPSEDYFCIQCGQKLLSDSAFCTACGAKAPEENNPPEKGHSATESRPEKAATLPEDIKPKPATKPPKNAAPRREAPPPKKPAAERPQKKQASQAAGGILSNMQRKHMLIIGGITVVLLAVVIGLVIFLASGSRSQDDPHSYYINRVVNGHLDNHQNMTVGVAFERFFTDFEWVYNYDDDEFDLVSFSGTMLRDNVPTPVQFIFAFTADGTDFDVIVLMLGGIMQDETVKNELLDYVFASTR